MISFTSDAGGQAQAVDLSPLPRQATSFPATLFHLPPATLGARPRALVREAMAGRDGETLRQIYTEEALPGFASKGMEPAVEAYLATPLDRFGNLFLDHRIAVIAQNHARKCDRRFAALRNWIGADAHPMPRLWAVLMCAGGEQA